MKIATISVLIMLFAVLLSFKTTTMSKKQPVYKVKKISRAMKINADWNKPQWKDTEAIELNNSMGEVPAFRPVVKAKMLYDNENIYVIFKVEDRFIRCVTKDVNGPVCEDSAVELFFSPDEDAPEKYFNLETNCGGTPLMFYNIIPRKDFKILDPADIQQIEISHSLPQIINPEIAGPVTWTIEYRIPVSLLKKYSNVTQPKPGSVWKANFYKCADKTSNIHYLTWAHVTNDQPDFHLPQFFGDIKFE
jgi:hypothetical protein